MKGTRSEVATKLQDANKKLRAEVRSLRKKVKQSDDELLLLQEIWQTEIAEIRELKRSRKKKDDPLCPTCGNPTLDIKVIGIWRLERCSSCDHFDRYQGE